MTTLEAALARRRALESGERWAADIGTSGLEERIWLGAGRDAQNLEVLRQRRITHILNVADDVPNFHEAEEGLTYLQLGVVDFGGDAGIMRVFDDAIAFVNGVFRSDNGRVLIHCANGSNRSSTVAIAVLMGALGMSLAQAWALVHARRAEARPLQDNRRQLLAFESSRLAPGASPTMIEGAGGVLVPSALAVALAPRFCPWSSVSCDETASSRPRNPSTSAAALPSPPSSSSSSHPRSPTPRHAYPRRTTGRTLPLWLADTCHQDRHCIVQRSRVMSTCPPRTLRTCLAPSQAARCPGCTACA